MLNHTIEHSHMVPLIILAFIVAVISAYIAVCFIIKILEASRLMTNVLLVFGALSMGVSIWSFHFIAMLGFKVPSNITHELWTIIGSITVSIVGSLITLKLLRENNKIFLPSFTFSISILFMHYLGMYGMKVEEATKTYAINWIILSVLIATIGIFITFNLLKNYSHMRKSKTAYIMIAFLLGGSIYAMHGLGMYSLTLHYISVNPASNTMHIEIEEVALSLMVFIVNILCWLFAFLFLYTERRFKENEEKTFTLF